MKKYLKLSLIIASSLFLSACGTEVKNSSNDSTTTTPSEVNEKSGSSFSIRDLIAKNIPQKCTYSVVNEEGSFDSEIIISGNKFKQVVTVKSEIGEEKINSVSDGEYIYTWGSNSSQGDFAIKTKADFDINSEISEGEPSDVDYKQVDLDSEFQGKCSPTVVSSSDFQPPANIKFQDINEMIEQMKKSLPEIDLTDLE